MKNRLVHEIQIIGDQWGRWLLFRLRSSSQEISGTFKFKDNYITNIFLHKINNAFEKISKHKS